MSGSSSATAVKDPAVLTVLPDGTVLYRTCQQAEQAAQQLKDTGQGVVTVKKLSQVRYGEQYQAKDGQVVPYTLGRLAEFQLTGLIVVIVVLTGLSLICAVIGRLIKQLERPSVEASSVAPVVSFPPPLAASTIHPGLTDQQLVVLLTAAACEVLDSPVRVDRFRPLTARDWNWAAQGRSTLQSHQLK